MSSYNCEASFVKADVPEMIRVTVVTDDVKTKVSNKPGGVDSLKRDLFAQNGFISRVKDD